MEHIRQPAVAGTFYPAGRQELQAMLDAMLAEADALLAKEDAEAAGEVPEGEAPEQQPEGEPATPAACRGRRRRCGCLGGPASGITVGRRCGIFVAGDEHRDGAVAAAGVGRGAVLVLVTDPVSRLPVHASGRVAVQRRQPTVSPRTGPDSNATRSG